MEKQHCYYFVFLESDANGAATYLSGAVALNEPKFSQPMIVAARKIAGAQPGAVMISLSYLGEMTPEEFGNPPTV